MEMEQPWKWKILRRNHLKQAWKTLHTLVPPSLQIDSQVASEVLKSERSKANLIIIMLTLPKT